MAIETPNINSVKLSLLDYANSLEAAYLATYAAPLVIHNL